MKANTDTAEVAISRLDFLKLVAGGTMAAALGSTVGRFLSFGSSSKRNEQDQMSTTPTQQQNPPSTAYMTYLSKLWWIWISAIPADMNPSFDKTGQRIYLGGINHGADKVFFLPQGFDDKEAWAAPPEMESRPLPPGHIRRAKIRADGKSLFFPLNTSICFENIHDADLKTLSPMCNADVDQTYSTILELKSNDDKHPLTAKKTERVYANLSNIFMIKYADPPMFKNFRPPNQQVRAVSAGIWCLTNPLHKGIYDITYGAKNHGTVYGGIPWETSYRYILEVV